MSEQRWSPSRREQHFLWYVHLLTQAVTRGIGGLGLIYELFVDQLNHGLALVVFGALASSVDIVSFGSSLIRQALGERKQIDEALDALEKRRLQERDS